MAPRKKKQAENISLASVGAQLRNPVDKKVLQAAGNQIESEIEKGLNYVTGLRNSFRIAIAERSIINSSPSGDTHPALTAQLKIYADELESIVQDLNNLNKNYKNNIKEQIKQAQVIPKPVNPGVGAKIARDLNIIITQMQSLNNRIQPAEALRMSMSLNVELPRSPNEKVPFINRTELEKTSNGLVSLITEYNKQNKELAVEMKKGIEAKPPAQESQVTFRRGK